MCAFTHFDLHVTTATLPRTSVNGLPADFVLTCNRVTGWALWNLDADVLIAGEFEVRGLRLDVAGTVILDTLGPRREVSEE